MATRIQDVMEAVEELSPLEQLDLISTISHSLLDVYRQDDREKDFWHTRTLDELAAAQQVQPVVSLSDLKAGFWPEGESIDEFIDYVYEQRCEDRSN